MKYLIIIYVVGSVFFFSSCNPTTGITSRQMDTETPAATVTIVPTQTFTSTPSPSSTPTPVPTDTLTPTASPTADYLTPQERANECPSGDCWTISGESSNVPTDGKPPYCTAMAPNDYFHPLIFPGSPESPGGKWGPWGWGENFAGFKNTAPNTWVRTDWFLGGTQTIIFNDSGFTDSYTISGVTCTKVITRK